MQCPKRNKLATRAMEVLSKLNQLTQEQIECLKTNEQRRLLELDRELEVVFGEKERSFGALREHSDEHGC